MIFIRIDLWPLGRKEKAKTLATAKIWNNATSKSNKLGNYNFELTLMNEDKIWREGTIKDFPRKRYNMWYLLNLILKDIL